MTRTILVTGASGFVGQSVCSRLLGQGFAVRAAVRSIDSIPSAEGLDVVAVGEIDAQTEWDVALKGVDSVIHCAARAHVMHQSEEEALEAYRMVNVSGTLRLAEQAAALSTRRLVFLSSIKVNGEKTRFDKPFLYSDMPAPDGLYGLSKWEAEQALWALSVRTGLEVVVVRAPLTYGPGVKGNLLRLLRWVESGMPLPLGMVQNQRSMMGLYNLTDLMLRCVEHPAAIGQTFLASDGDDLSTPQLIRLIAEGLNRSAHLLPAPVALLQASGLVLGKRGDIDRLVCSLQVDIGHTQSQLSWTPKVSVTDGVQEMARWYSKVKAAQA